MSQPLPPPPAPHNCNSCEHFNDYGTWCRRWQAAPPEDVQKVGCDEYSYDEIPF